MDSFVVSGFEVSLVWYGFGWFGMIDFILDITL